MKAVILSFLVLLSSCGKPATENQKPIVLTNMAPYTYFLEKIAGDTVIAQSLIPAGSNPHQFEPTLKEMTPLKTAKLWLCASEPFEAKLASIAKEHNPSLTLVDLSEGIPLILEGCCHSEDRHFWLSPREAQKQATLIKEALSKTFPEHSSLYQQNLEKFLAELDSLDQEIHEMLASHAGEAIVVTHPAFGYFCRDYGIHQLSIEKEGKDPLPGHISSLLDTMRQNQVSAIFAQPQYSNKGAEILAEKLGMDLYMVDPYSGDYPETLRAIAKRISHD